MAHKTLVGGTAYEIGGGKDLIGGTVYEKDHGKTLVGGTAYEVGFDDGMRTITVTRDYTFDGYNGSVILRVGNTSYLDNGECYVGGQGNWTSPTTIEVPVGTPISFEVERNISKVEVILNGTVVFEEYGDYVSWYEEYTVTKNVTLAMTRSWYGQDQKYTLTITEE